ncbi:MAG: response regulator [Chloroflexi bacterium]|nr:response regulator [Chloroflexota bacterium]
MKPVKRAQILHLENKAEWLREVQLALSDEHQVYSATSLQQAVKLFQEMEFDLVIADLDLVKDTGEDEQGFRLIDALQAAGILPGNRVIILSGFTHQEERTRRAFRDYDVWDVIPKDKYDPAELKREVAEVIQTPLHYES